jgi:hypothetical protein
LQGSENFGSIGEKNFSPECGGACGDAGGVTVARAGEGEGGTTCGEDESGGNAVGEMADAGDLGVVVRGVHREDAGAERLPERGSIKNCFG